MKKETIRSLGFPAFLFILWVTAYSIIPLCFSEMGIYGSWFETHPWLKLSLVFIGMAHLTVAAMSISFHRVHTHQSVKLHWALDQLMQTFLWAVTSMSKLDWVSVHIYHHAHSDTVKDAHSPKQKGLFHVFFMGALDYSSAKNWPEVLKIRERIPANAYERFISRNLFLGPIILSSLLMIIFGPKFGSILSVFNFSISPLFAVGGVNAIAHAFGYQNYESKDESRNIGFLFLLNWITCGEMDHNNHHRYPKSPTFAHRWFEFDIGWVYIRVMKAVGLAKVLGTIPNYNLKLPSLSK